MMRWDIINHLIKQNNYKFYLEIGYYKGWSFDRVECERKYAVDPNPSKFPYQQQMSNGEMLDQFPVEDREKVSIINKNTSDNYFKELPDWVKFDIIFIDGLHESQQVDRDIQNALKCLNPGGTIVMHDCNPSSYEMTTTGTASGEWTGDVYKSFIKARVRLAIQAYTVDTDYGVGIIRPIIPDRMLSSPFGVIPDWEEFDKHRALYLELITPEEFVKRETKSQETNVKTTTDNLSLS